MNLRSGKLYDRENVDSDQLESDLQGAISLEDLQFETGFGLEDLELSSQPPSPLTPSSPVQEVDLDPVEPLQLTAQLEKNVNKASKTKPTYPPRSSVYKMRQSERSKLRKSAKRKAIATADHPALEPAQSLSVHRRHKDIVQRASDFDAQSMLAAKAAFIGAPYSSGRKMNDTIVNLRRRQFGLVKWDGKTPKLITDKHGRIIAFLLGQPDDSSWLKAIADLMVTLRNFRISALRDGVVKAADFIHRRGFFLAIARGYSFGGGRMKPGNTVHSRRLRQRLDKLYEDTNLIRVAGFQNWGLASFAPKIFHYMKTTLKKLSSHSSGSGLLRNFKNSAYPMCTINFGPETACFEHTDDANGAGLLCLITAVSNHNPHRGGHMVLYSLKLMVEFPSGSTIGLPSASVPHGNTPIQDGEERYSVTQYCPGGLLRWVHYGFRTVKTLLVQNGGKEEKKKLDGKVGSRWEWALGLFSKVDELDADREALRKGTL